MSRPLLHTGLEQVPIAAFGVERLPRSVLPGRLPEARSSIRIPGLSNHRLRLLQLGQRASGNRMGTQTLDDTRPRARLQTDAGAHFPRSQPWAGWESNP